MAIPVTGQVGPAIIGDGVTTQPVRQGRGGDVIVSELHGRFYEQTYRGYVYGNGTTTLTALSANTITLTATTTPILGVWNPLSSTANLVISQAELTLFANTFTTPVGPGTFVWAVSINNAAITTGSAPWNRKTLSQNGSQAKGMSFVALTGLTNNLVIMEGSDF